VLLMKGIPCLYYGTENGMLDSRSKPNEFGESGRLTLIPAGKLENFEFIRKGKSFQGISALIALRKQFPVLNEGLVSSMWTDVAGDNTDDGVIAIARYRFESGQISDPAIVVVNASEYRRATSAGQRRMKLLSRSNKPLLAEGDRLIRIPIPGFDAPDTREQVVDVAWFEGVPQVELVLNPQSVNVYRIKTSDVPAATTVEPETAK